MSQIQPRAAGYKASHIELYLEMHGFVMCCVCDKTHMWDMSNSHFDGFSIYKIYLLFLVIFLSTACWTHLFSTLQVCYVQSWTSTKMAVVIEEEDTKLASKEHTDIELTKSN